MMRDSAAGGSARTHLDGADPPRFLNRYIGHRLEPHVLAMSRHRVRFRFYDQIRRPELFRKNPAIIVRPLLRWRHVLAIAKRRARVDPANYGCDLVVCE